MPDSNEKEGGKESDDICEQPPGETELKDSGTVTVKFYPKPPPPPEPKQIHPRRPAPLVPGQPRDPHDKDEQ